MTSNVWYWLKTKDIKNEKQNYFSNIQKEISENGCFCKDNSGLIEKQLQWIVTVTKPF